MCVRNVPCDSDQNPTVNNCPPPCRTLIATQQAIQCPLAMPQPHVSTPPHAARRTSLPSINRESNHSPSHEQLEQRRHSARVSGVAWRGGCNNSNLYTDVGGTGSSELSSVTHAPKGVCGTNEMRINYMKIYMHVCVKKEEENTRLSSTHACSAPQSLVGGVANGHCRSNWAAASTATAPLWDTFAAATCSRNI
ncbi:unnamed protein product [Ceratitis capitata]|uniref:(Mediterranean fruit fly) hypothetical protein n=1 Tax=Ceratitis capitata TaxID=7213 RepID=A0A811VEX3_CERCA|nr:unnamed protein product [Ceratitis capitata]